MALYTAALRMYDCLASSMPATQYAGPNPVSDVTGRLLVKRVFEKSCQVDKSVLLQLWDKKVLITSI